MAEPPRPPPKKYSLFTVALVMKTLTKNKRPINSCSCVDKSSNSKFWLGNDLVRIHTCILSQSFLINSLELLSDLQNYIKHHFCWNIEDTGQFCWQHPWVWSTSKQEICFLEKKCWEEKGVDSFRELKDLEKKKEET